MKATRCWGGIICLLLPIVARSNWCYLAQMVEEPPNTASAFDLDDAGRGIGEYPQWPTRNEIKEILEFARKTGIPENFYRLCLTKPDLTIEHHVISKLDVPSIKRPNGKHVWCALCQTWKFCYGRLLWTPLDGAIRPIGHVCAGGHFGDDRYRRMYEETNRLNRREQNEYYLIEKLPHIRVHIDSLARYEAMATAIQTSHTDLFRHLPNVSKHIYNAFKEQGGLLTVERKRDKMLDGPSGMRTSAGISDYDTIAIATLHGAPFGKKSFKPLNLMRPLVSELEDLLVGNTEEAALSYVTGLDESGVNNLAKRLNTLLRRALKLESDIADASGFLTPESFRDINKWLNDADCSCRAFATMRGPNLSIREPGGSSVLLRPISHVVRFHRNDGSS